MAQRRAGARVGPPPPVPEWVADFTLADWYDPQEPVPLAEQVDRDGDVRWRCLQAWRRWAAAGRAWLGEVGYDNSWRAWFRVAGFFNPGDPYSLARRVRSGAA